MTTRRFYNMRQGMYVTGETGYPSLIRDFAQDGSFDVLAASEGQESSIKTPYVTIEKANEIKRELNQHK